MYSQQAVGQKSMTSQRSNGSDISFGRCNPNRQLVGQRRWWESNPLQLLCRQPPSHLAPASVDHPQVPGGHWCFYSLKVVVAIDAIKSALISNSTS